MELKDIDDIEEMLIHEDDFDYYDLFNGYYDPSEYLKHQDDIDKVIEALDVLDQYVNAITLD